MSCDPVYDLIEANKFVEAIKYAQRVELRQMPLSQGLQSYCLHKLGRRTEALEMARACMSAFSTDENVLLVLKQTLRGCRRDCDLVAYLETLSQLNPDKAPNYCRELFHLYAFLQDAKKMQLTAQRLYKLTNRRCFVFWSVASMLLQDNLPPTMLMVAERMIAKVLDDEASAQPGAEELELFVDVLCRQKRFAEALARLDSLTARSSGPPIAEQADLDADSSVVKMGALKKSIIRVKLLELLGTTAAAKEQGLDDEAEVQAEVRRQLEAIPDQWESHRRMVAMVTRAERSAAAAEGAGTSADQGLSLLAHRSYLQSLSAKQPFIRGPRLAVIEMLLLHWQSPAGADGALPAGWAETPAPEGMNCSQALSPMQRESCALLASYLARFQSKQCCFGDVRTYLALLGGRGAAWAVGGPWLSADVGSPVLETLRAWALVGAEALEAELAAMAVPAPAAGKGKKKKGKEGDASLAGMEEREKIVEKLCASSKLRQIALHCAHLLAPDAGGPDSFPAENAAVALYLSTKRLCAGGVGGEKEVQPGDEMLLVQSARHRLLTRAALAGRERGEGRPPQAAEVAVRCMRWLRLLLFASECSPHAFAFRVDMLEPLRLLGVGEAGLISYNRLRPKHMQHDSLGYLVAPALLETGFMGEARELYVKLTKFALSARGETSDMMARAVEKGNYATSLQMHAFLRRISGSLQLHVAFVENALFELTLNDRMRDPPVACAHLKHFGVVPAIAESTAGDAVRSLLEARGAALLTDEDLAGLSDNGDYELVVRCDETILAEEAEGRARRAQLVGRIKVAQLVHRALYYVLEGEVAEGQSYVDQLAALVGADGGDGGGGSGGLGYFMWSQEVSPGAVGRGEGGDVYSTALWGTIITGMRFSLSCCRMVEAAMGQGSKAADALTLKAEDLSAEALAAAINADLAEMAVAAEASAAVSAAGAGAAGGASEGASADASALTVLSPPRSPGEKAFRIDDVLSNMGRVQAENQALAAASTAALAGLRDMLLQTAGPHSRYLPAPEGRRDGAKDGKGAAVVFPLSGEWIRRVAAFSRTLATYLPLLLSAALISLPSSAGDRKDGKGASKAGRDKDKDKKGKPSATTVPPAIANGTGDDKAPDVADSDRNQERYHAAMREVGDACRQVAEGLAKLMDGVSRVLGDVEVDLQTSDDYGSFFAAWDAALAEADGTGPADSAAGIAAAGAGGGMGGGSVSGGGGAGGGTWGEGAPTLATVSQQLHSSQLMSVQRIRAALSSQVDALRRWLAHTGQAGHEGVTR